MQRSARVLFAVAERLLLFFVLCSLFFMGAVSPAHAQYETSTNPDVPENTHTRTQIMLLELMSAGICQLAGIDVISPQQGCLGVDPTTHKIGYAPPTDQPRVGGLLGMVTDSTRTLYTPPASGIDYTRSIAQNFGIVKKAVAQEPGAQNQEEYTGFTALQPVRYVWSIARNLTYFFFVIAFVLIGIAIMLRVKINPQTVMSIQNQIPKIIVAILLITFSYAIVGFMIDLMWTFTYFTINTLSPAITSTYDSDPQAVQEVATANLYNNPIIYFNDLFNSSGQDNHNMIADMAGGIGETIGNVITDILFSVFGVNAQTIECNTQFGGLLDFGDCLGKGIANGLAFIFGIVGKLIIVCALLIAAIRVWFMLIRAYIYVIMYTIVSPIYIFMGILPGSSLGFTNWFRAVAASLLVFPATIAMFLLARFFAVGNSPYDVQNTINTQYNPFVPPLIGNPSIQHNIGLLIAFGIVMLIPEMLTIIRDAVKAKPNPYITPAIEKGFAAGAGLAAAGPAGLALRGLWRTDQHGRPMGAVPTLITSVANNSRRPIVSRAARAVSAISGMNRTPGGGGGHAP
jgi:hypothetical protein